MSSAPPDLVLAPSGVSMDGIQSNDDHLVVTELKSLSSILHFLSTVRSQHLRWEPSL